MIKYFWRAYYRVLDLFGKNNEIGLGKTKVVIRYCRENNIKFSVMKLK